MPTTDPIEKKSRPTSKEVNDFHDNADTNRSPRALHHTLGALPGQASPGDHSHNGGSSQVLSIEDLPKPLLGVSITGSRGGNLALASVINALKELGASDATTP